MKNVTSPPTCIIILLHAHAAIKVAYPTSTPSYCIKSSGYDRRIMTFVDIVARECIEIIEYLNDKDEPRGHNGRQ